MGEEKPVFGRGFLRAQLPTNPKPAESSSSNAPDAGDAPLPVVSTFKSGFARGRGFLTRQSTLPNPVSPTLTDTAKISTVTEQLEKLTTSSEVSAKSQPVLESVEPVVKKGSIGETCKIGCNYIRLNVRQGCGIFLHHVDFHPAVDEKGVRIKLVKGLVQTKRGIRCFDGGSILYLPERIEPSPAEYTGLHPINEKSIKVKVTCVRQLKYTECGTLYNVLFNSISRELEYSRLGRQFFNPQAAHIIPQHRLQIWPGYVTTVAELDGGLMLCCDTTHRVLRRETALEVLISVMKSGDPKIAAEKALIGASVLTEYNNKLYRIDEINWDLNPTDKFERSDGSSISYFEYYKQQYNIDITDLKQPMLVHKKNLKDTSFTVQLVNLVPEICLITGLTDAMRNDFKLMKDIACFTRITPQQRHVGFLKFIENIKASPKALNLLSEWGLELNSSGPLVTNARLLPRETVRFGTDKRSNMPITFDKSVDWGREVRDSVMYRICHLTKWCIISQPRDKQRAQKLSQTLCQVGPGLGMIINEPDVKTYANARVQDLASTLTQLKNSNYQACVVIMPGNRDDLYSTLKKIVCHDFPLISQVVLSRTLDREKIRPIVQNVAIQISCKLGGAPWIVKVPMKDTMVCGMDTYHDKAGGSSVAAFVSTSNSDFSSYFSQANILKRRQELNLSLVHVFTACLQNWMNMNQSLPKTVMVYRDGVGDGDFKEVKELEISQFQKACRNFGDDYQPMFVFIVIRNRIDTRYFHVNNQKFENAQPGTVVDHTITRQGIYDFFIVSQMVRQGTASPTHFIVLKNTTSLTPDQLQMLTFKFCHMYYNWSGTIRVPAPCRYAHKLASLVGSAVRDQLHPSLSNTLFYL